MMYLVHLYDAKVKAKSYNASVYVSVTTVLTAIMSNSLM